MSVSVRSTPSTALITLAEKPLQHPGVPDPHLQQVVPGARDVVALENLLFLRNARQEAGLDRGLVPADKNERQQFQAKRFRRHLGVQPWMTPCSLSLRTRSLTDETARPTA